MAIQSCYCYYIAGFCISFITGSFILLAIVLPMSTYTYKASGLFQFYITAINKSIFLTRKPGRIITDLFHHINISAEFQCIGVSVIIHIDYGAAVSLDDRRSLPLGLGTVIGMSKRKTCKTLIV